MPKHRWTAFDSVECVSELVSKRPCKNVSIIEDPYQPIVYLGETSDSASLVALRNREPCASPHFFLHTLVPDWNFLEFVRCRTFIYYASQQPFPQVFVFVYVPAQVGPNLPKSSLVLQYTQHTLYFATYLPLENVPMQVSQTLHYLIPLS